jgi:predicted RND superfamily exporter protein
VRLDPNPLFRRIIMPWYDSTPICWLLLLFMVGLSIFSVVGIVVALENPAYHRHQWVPWTLLALSMAVGFSVSSRLYRRHQQQHRDAVEP